MAASQAGAARAAIAPLAVLLGLTLSCAVGPLAPVVPEATDVTGAPVAPTREALAEPDPVHDALRAHMRRYQRRSGLTAEELDRLAHTVIEEARRHGFDPLLVAAVIHVESRFDAFAVSPKNALGLMQLLPSTGAWLAPRVGVPWRGPETLFDPTSNVKLGVAYLRQLTDRYDGSVRTALLAYNWGPGRIDRRLRAGTPLPREYANLVLTAYRPSS